MRGRSELDFNAEADLGVGGLLKSWALTNNGSLVLVIFAQRRLLCLGANFSLRSHFHLKIAPDRFDKSSGED